MIIKSGPNLAPGGDSNGGYDVFLRDRKEHVTHLVSASPPGTPGNSSSFEAAISGDGSRVAFGSNASDHVVGDTNGVSDIFVLTNSGP